MLCDVSRPMPVIQLGPVKSNQKASGHRICLYNQASEILKTPLLHSKHGTPVRLD